MLPSAQHIQKSRSGRLLLPSEQRPESREGFWDLSSCPPNSREETALSPPTPIPLPCITPWDRGPRGNPALPSHDAGTAAEV